LDKAWEEAEIIIPDSPKKEEFAKFIKALRIDV